MKFLKIFFMVFVIGSISFSAQKGEKKIYESPFGFSFSYLNEPGQNVENSGLNKKSGAYEIIFNQSFNLAGMISVYESKNVLNQKLEMYAKEKYQSIGSPECKKNPEDPACENEAIASSFKKIKFQGFTAYYYEVSTQPMPYTLLIFDYKNRRIEIKNHLEFKDFKLK